MRLAFAGWVASLVLPQPNNVVDTFATQPLAQPVVTVFSLPTTVSAPSSNSALLHEGVSLWLSDASNSGPSKADVALLRSAFAEFYGVNRNLEKSLDLLTQAIEAWQNQPPDERARLYRARGDCYILLAKAEAAAAAADYSQAINLIQGPGGSSADPEELPAALLGRARALKAQLVTSNPAGQQQLAQDGAADYRKALELTGYQEEAADAVEDIDGKLTAAFNLGKLYALFYAIFYFLLAELLRRLFLNR